MAFPMVGRAPDAAGSRQKAMSAVLSPRSWLCELSVREDPLGYLGTQPRWSEANKVVMKLGRKLSLIDHASPPVSPCPGGPMSSGPLYSGNTTIATSVGRFSNWPSFAQKDPETLTLRQASGQALYPLPSSQALYPLQSSREGGFETRPYLRPRSSMAVRRSAGSGPARAASTLSSSSATVPTPRSRIVMSGLASG